jgi:hypothetical protein
MGCGVLTGQARRSKKAFPRHPLPNTLTHHPSPLLPYIQRAGEQCFLIEQPQGTLVTVEYENPAYATQKLNLVASLRSGPGTTGSSSKMIQQVQMDEEKGHVKFATVKDGFHSLCIVPSKVTKPTKIGLEVRYGKPEAFYTDLAKEAHIDLLEASIMRLNAQMGQILNEADYMKDKEVLFHQQCERTNSAARWWPILQVAILLVTGVLQVNNLKQFFKARRLV